MHGHSRLITDSGVDDDAGSADDDDRSTEVASSAPGLLFGPIARGTLFLLLTVSHAYYGGGLFLESF